jgi:ABC-type lipoprotein release transport system permease subunit
MAARARRFWRAWLLLAVLVALGTAVVLAAVTAGRRADSAFPRFAAAHGYDAVVYANGPLPLARLPGVARTVPIQAPFYGQPWCSCGRTIDTGSLAVREVRPADLSRMVKLVAGRMPDQANPNETLASYTMQRDYGIGPGTVIRLPMAGANQWAAIQQAMNGGPQPKPTGPVIAVRVVGIVAAENEFPSGQGPTYDLYPTQAFAAATHGTPALPFYYVSFRHGEADFARFEATVSGKYNANVEDLDRAAAAIAVSIHPQAIGWWALAALAALAAIAATGQALARQTAVESADHPVLAALGVRSRQFTALCMIRTLAVALTGAAAGVLLATLLSPLAPAGEARLADPAPGLTFDWAVAVAGGAAAVLAVLLLGLLPALRATRVRDAGYHPAARASLVTGAAIAAGLPATGVLGIRRALQRGRGARATPVGTALAGTVAAVTALCATAVFGASLSHLVASPELYGSPFQAFVNGSGPGSPDETGLLAALARVPAIDRVTLVSVPAVTVNKIGVRAATVTPVRGAVLLSAADGRLPAGEGEIALGAATMRASGARIGGSVRVTVTDPDGAPRTRRFLVVGMLPLPVDFGTGALGDGAAMTTAAYVAAQCPPAGDPASQRRCRQAATAGPPEGVLVHAVPGPAGAAALADLTRRYPGNVGTPDVPTALVSFGESANFPLLLGIVVALCGAATLAHLLVASAYRRRSESGLLQALGFVRRQLAAVVCWQAATVAVVGVAAGVPLGLAAGRVIWSAFARNLGVVAVVVLPGWLIAALAAGVIAAALAIAVIPAVTASRSTPAAALRAE